MEKGIDHHFYKFGWRRPSAQSPFKKFNFGKSGQKVRKSKIRTKRYGRL